MCKPNKLKKTFKIIMMELYIEILNSKALQGSHVLHTEFLPNPTISVFLTVGIFQRTCQKKGTWASPGLALAVGQEPLDCGVAWLLESVACIECTEEGSARRRTQKLGAVFDRLASAMVA